MNLHIDQSELRPLIEVIVQQTVEQLQSNGSKLGASNRLAYLESEAAGLVGVKASVLRDARLRREITATKVGGRLAYEAVELQRYLTANRQD